MFCGLKAIRIALIISVFSIYSNAVNGAADFNVGKHIEYEKAEDEGGSGNN